MATNLPVLPDVSSFPATRGQRYRFTGIAPADATLNEVASALQLGSPQVWFAGAPGFPSDWPSESPPPLGSGQRSFHAEGIWTQSAPIPATLRLAPGRTLIVAQVWTVVAGAVQPASTVTPASLGPTQKSLIGGALLLSVGIFGVGLALVMRHRQQAASMPPHRALRNPVQYHSTVTHRGVPIHVHVKDGKYCADFRAIETTDPFAHGGVVCAPKRELAVLSAKTSIDRQLGRA